MADPSAGLEITFGEPGAAGYLSVGTARYADLQLAVETWVQTPHADTLTLTSAAGSCEIPVSAHAFHGERLTLLAVPPQLRPSWVLRATRWGDGAPPMWIVHGGAVAGLISLAPDPAPYAEGWQELTDNAGTLRAVVSYAWFDAEAPA